VGSLSVSISATVSNTTFSLVVILVGRLRLSPSRAIESYLRLVPVIPTQAATSDEERKSNTEAFKVVFIQVLESAGFDRNTLMLEKDGVKM
jgi:hypothetical protein